MKKKTIAMLGISTLCVFGFGIGAQAAYTVPCATGVQHISGHTSSWHTTHREEIKRSVRTNTETQAEISTPIVEPVNTTYEAPATQVTYEIPAQTTENPCVYGHDNCNGFHDSEPCADGYSDCYGNHDAGYHHAETSGHHQGNGHHGGHHQ